MKDENTIVSGGVADCNVDSYEMRDDHGIDRQLRQGVEHAHQLLGAAGLGVCYAAVRFRTRGLQAAI